MDMIETILDMMFEARDKQGEEIKYYLKPRNTPYGEIAKKIQKIGNKKIISLKTDSEEISGYSYLFIYESLLLYEGDPEDLLALDNHITCYCYDRFNKLSKEDGINYNFHWNKTTKKYEVVKLSEYEEGMVSTGDVNEANDEYNRTEGFIKEFFTEEYLTGPQLEFCKAFLTYGANKGGAIIDLDGNELYSKQLAYCYRRNIRSRLEEYYDSALLF
jgi:hypothetical protein